MDGQKRYPGGNNPDAYPRKQYLYRLIALPLPEYSEIYINFGIKT